jgi:hypothetical protein
VQEKGKRKEAEGRGGGMAAFGGGRWCSWRDGKLRATGGEESSWRLWFGSSKGKGMREREKGDDINRQ